MSECGIVENLLLLQCEDRLAGPLCGHLETALPEDVEKVGKGTVVIHHSDAVVEVAEDALVVNCPFVLHSHGHFIGHPCQSLILKQIYCQPLAVQTWSQLQVKTSTRERTCEVFYYAIYETFMHTYMRVNADSVLINTSGWFGSDSVKLFRSKCLNDRSRSEQRVPLPSTGPIRSLEMRSCHPMNIDQFSPSRRTQS